MCNAAPEELVKVGSHGFPKLPPNSMDAEEVDICQKRMPGDIADHRPQLLHILDGEFKDQSFTKIGHVC